MKTLLATAAVLSVALSMPAAAGSKSECRALFAKVDRNGDGTLSRSENVKYYLNRITLGESNSQDDFIMKREFFLWHCERGMF